MPDFRAPTAEQVQQAMRKVTTYQLRRAFYEGLKNPLWVRPLADAGAFANPPEPEIGSDGLLRETYWPEASYLANMAEQVPTEVVNVLVSLAGSSNSWVRRVVFAVGARVPSDVAARLKPAVDAWADTGYGWRTDPQDLVSLAVNLLQGGETSFGISFANRLFRPLEIERSSDDPVTVLESYWYSEQLPRVTRALGENALRTVLPWLILYERQQGNIGDDFDHSGFGRSQIAQSQDSYHEIQDALIDAVRDAAIEGLERDPESAWRELSRNQLLIVRRIALFAVAELLERRLARDDEHGDLISMGRELVLDEKSRAEDAVPDFIRLLRALGTASSAELDQLANVLASGHLSEQETQRISRNMREQGRPEDEIQAEISRWDKNWRHRILAGVGRDLLPGALQGTLDALDAEGGVVSDPLRPPFQTSSWVGPNSPISQGEMSALAPMELLAQLEGWHDEGSGWGPGPSHEGQARVLEAVLTGNPLALQGEHRLTRQLRPTYLRAIFAGWEGAYKADLELPWEQVLLVATEVLHHSEESDFAVEGGRFDDDADFSGAKQAAIQLLSHLASKGSAEKMSGEHLGRLAQLLLSAAAGTSAWSEYILEVSERESGWDPLMVSLNFKWPILLRGLIHLVGLGSTKQWYPAALATLDQQLALDDPRGASSAVLGEGLGRLFNHARDWLAERMATYFGTQTSLDRNQQIALTTAITIHYYHPDLYKLLSDPMIAALHSEEQVSVGWGNKVSPQQRIGHWVIEAVIGGHTNGDDALRTEFYAHADPEIRGDAMGHIAWSFMHADVVDDSIRDRLADLWDERVLHVKTHPEDEAELNDFYWFIRSEKFPASWWMPRLKEALELNGELETKGMIGEQLAVAAHEFPRAALDALTMLLAPEETSDRHTYDLRTHSLAPVIAAALATSVEKLRTDALALMNLMGARGEIDLEKRVRVILDADPEAGGNSH